LLKGYHRIGVRVRVQVGCVITIHTNLVRKCPNLGGIWMGFDGTCS